MLAEAITKLEELCQEAVGVEVLPLAEADPRGRFLHTGTGGVERIELPVPPRDHETTSIDSFVRAAADYSAQAVWVSLGRAVAVLDDHGSDDEADYRCERVRLPLLPSSVFDVLDRLATRKLQHRDFVTLLRHDLRTAELVPDDLERVVTKIKFRSLEEGQANAGRTAAELGLSVLKEMTGDGDLPEQVSVTFQPYPALLDEAPEPVTVGCSLLVDVDERAFLLRPLPGELEVARRKATQQVADAILRGLREKTNQAPVYLGTP